MTFQKQPRLECSNKSICDGENNVPIAGLFSYVMRGFSEKAIHRTSVHGHFIFSVRSETINCIWQHSEKNSAIPHVSASEKFKLRVQYVDMSFFKNFTVMKTFGCFIIPDIKVE